jgi:hypothetical protein
MGYRLVPTRVAYPTCIVTGAPFEIETRWTSRGVGRALRDYELQFSLVTLGGRVVATASGGLVQTNKWAAGQEHNVSAKAVFKNVPAGSYELAIGLYDDKSHREIELPIAGVGPSGKYRIGPVTVNGRQTRVGRSKMAR